MVISALSQAAHVATGLIQEAPVVQWGTRIVTFPFKNPTARKVGIVLGGLFAVGLGIILVDLIMENEYDRSQAYQIRENRSNRQKERKQFKKKESNSQPSKIKPGLALPQLPELKTPTKEDIFRLRGPIRAKGSKNPTNDCFMNALMEMLMLSGFYRYLLEPSRFTGSDEKLQQLLYWFFDEYSQGHETRTDYFRRFLGFPEGEQSDSHEALHRLTDRFKIDDLHHSYTVEKKVEIPEQALDSIPLGCPVLNEDNTVQEKAPKPIFNIPLHFGEVSDKEKVYEFKGLWEQFFSEELVDVDTVFQKNGQAYKTETAIKQTKLKDLKSDLFINLVRYHSKMEKIENRVIHSKMEKIKNRVIVEKTLQVNDSTYELSSFIVHQGPYGGGHYVACGFDKLRNSWVEIDNATVEEITEKEALKRAEVAYLFCFQDNTHPERQFEYRARDARSVEESESGSEGSLPTSDSDSEASSPRPDAQPEEKGI